MTITKNHVNVLEVSSPMKEKKLWNHTQQHYWNTKTEYGKKITHGRIHTHLNTSTETRVWTEKDEKWCVCGSVSVTAIGKKREPKQPFELCEPNKHRIEFRTRSMFQSVKFDSYNRWVFCTIETNKKKVGNSVFGSTLSQRRNHSNLIIY